MQVAKAFFIGRYTKYIAFAIPFISFCNKISLPITFEKVLLSSTKYQTGDLLYGHMLMKVAPYYVSDVDFAKSPVYIQKEYDVYFKVEIARRKED